MLYVCVRGVMDVVFCLYCDACIFFFSWKILL